MPIDFEYFYGNEAERFIFFRIPKVLITDVRFRAMSTDSKLLYGLMLDRMGLSVKNGWVDEHNRVYIIYTMEEIIDDMGCARQKAAKLLDELDNSVGLIERKRQGLGKPNIIYVKNFTYSEKTKSDNQDSESMNIINQEVRKSYPNNNDINNTDFNNTDCSDTPSYVAQFMDYIGFENKERCCKVDVSIGYGKFNKNKHQTIDDLIKCCDKKMYADKKKKHTSG